MSPSRPKRKTETGIAWAALDVMIALLLAAGAGCGGGPGSATRPLVQATTHSSAIRDLKELAGNTVAIAGAGDVNLGDGVAPYLASDGDDYPWPDASEVFSIADLSVVNLECCISNGGSPVAGKEYTFRGTPQAAAGIAGAGVSVVSLANNHSKDYGTSAFLDTLANLKKAGVSWCGAGNNAAEAYAPTVLRAKDKQARVAFVGFTAIVPDGWPATSTDPGCAIAWDGDRVADTVRKASESADYVVVSFHWGTELATSPGGDQRSLAHLAIDNGADLVLGHHPHVVQGFELYKNRLIAYSLGNFIFSPPREISAKTVSVIAVLGPGGLVQAKVVPMVISSCRPAIIDGTAAESWLGAVRSYSSDLGTQMAIRSGRGFIDGAPRASTAAE